MLSKPRGRAFVELYECFDVIKQPIQTPRGESVVSVEFYLQNNNFPRPPLTRAIALTGLILRGCLANEKGLLFALRFGRVFALRLLLSTAPTLCSQGWIPSKTSGTRQP